MEAQDHSKAKQPGHEGHSGGVHVCHKCGWPFPNPHPSARHRRAHKKVCGTVEGYRLDNDAQDKTHLMDGSDGEHVSDDEHKTPSDKVVERTISRRSSSGVGSRSSRSNRSEDEVFTDAVTDFTDSPSPGEASAGVIQRYYSIQNVSESDFDDTKHTAENGGSDNLCAPSLNLKDNQAHVETVQNLEGENDRVEAGSLSQDHISSPALVSASVTGNDTNTDESKEIVLSKEMSELGTSYNETTEETSEDVSDFRADEKNLGDVAKSTELETTGSETNTEGSQNFCSPEHPVKAIHPANETTSKSSDVMEDHGPQTGANEDVYLLADRDASPLHKNPDIINPYKAPGCAVETETVESSIAHTAEVCSSDSKEVCSEGDDAMENKIKPDVGKKSNDEQNFEEPRQFTDIEASDGDVSKLRNTVITDYKTENLDDKNISRVEEQEPIVSLEKVLCEGAITSNGASNTGNSDKSNTEHLILQENDERELSGKELSGSSAIDDIQDSNDGNIGVVQTYMEGNEMRSRGEDNESVIAETAPGHGSSTVESHDVVHEPPEPERINDQVDYREVVMEGSGGSSREAVECVVEDGSGGTLKTDDLHGSGSKIIPSDVLEVCEDAQCSAAVDDTCTKSVADEASDVVEGDRSIVKQHVAVSAVDVIPDSSSQTDSLEGHWGSVSVMSALSDTPPAASTPASNHSPQAPSAEQNPTLDPKPSVEPPHTETSKMENISEIQTLEEEQQKNSAWSTSVSHLENAPHGGKRNEEIIAKVTNWSTDKHHTPLKTLLGEATAKSRAESPLHHSHQKDEIPVANNGSSKPENVPDEESTKEEAGKEWNSPARYPVNIKTEKRRAKGRGYWAPFLCCSSVNAR